MVNLYAKNVPAVFDIDPNYCDKLFLENSYFEKCKWSGSGDYQREQQQQSDNLPQCIL